MRISLLLALALAAALLLFMPPGAVLAGGIIIPPPCLEKRCPPPPCLDFCPPPRPIAQFEIKYHHVAVGIVDQLATTKVDQVFVNPNDWPLEGTYVFPLPSEAVVSGFKMWMDGQPVEGKLLNAEDARRIYEDALRKLNDPALLEYMGRGAFQVRVFPIPPGGERRIQIEYSQALKAENGLLRYTYPLNTEKFSTRPLDDVTIQVDVRDQGGLRAIYSPSHTVDITRQDEQRATLVYSAKHVLPDSDFTLYYSTGSQTGLHILSYRDPGDPQDADGYFLMLLAPGVAADQKPLPKDVLLVLDRSGSMEGVKFRQAQEALRYILKKLNPDDRFYLETFSSSVETYAPGLSPASEASSALTWVDRLQSTGSTDINRALLEAVSVVQPGRPTDLIFLTDGLPTLGELDSSKILDNVLRAAPASLRLFAFGVGYDVDTVLLDSLSEDHHGASTYVQPKEALDEVLSGFYERISQPVLTDLNLDFGAISVYDLYPQPLPDLFSGGQVLLAGRYRAGGQATLKLSGKVGERDVSQTFEGVDFSQDSRSGDPSMAAVARIWAARKIGFLLNQIRLDGASQEIVDQIVRLSTRFGIVTPYTSYLVTEENPLGADAQKRIAGDAFQQSQSAPPAASGQGAVERAAEEGKLKSAGAAPQVEQGSGNAVRTVGPRTFVLLDGVWTDTAYDPKAMTSTRLAFLSDAYLKLAASRPDIAAALALGNKIILVVDGKAYQVSPDATAQPTPSEPSSPEPPFPSPQATPARTEAAIVEATLTSPPQSANVQPTPTPAGGATCPGIGALILVVLAARIFLNPVR